MKTVKLIIASFLLIGMMSSCKDETTGSVYTLRLTDGPGPYTAVNIDLQRVEVKGDDDVAISLATNPGIYNLLNFSNGLSTIIATGGLEITKVKEIRLILGPNNSVHLNGQIYPLTIKNGDESGLKLKVHHKLEPGVAYNVLLDFDAGKSVVETGNGEYKLKPVIRTIETAISGSIKGSILPKGIVAFVEAVSANGTDYSTVVNSEGKFIIQGLPPGDYAVVISPAPPYAVVTKSPVNVTIGNATDIGKMQL